MFNFKCLIKRKKTIEIKKKNIERKTKNNGMMNNIIARSIDKTISRLNGENKR